MIVKFSSITILFHISNLGSYKVQGVVKPSDESVYAVTLVLDINKLKAIQNYQYLWLHTLKYIKIENNIVLLCDEEKPAQALRSG